MPGNSRVTLQQWQLYIIRTAAGNLYTGITTSLERRCKEHSNGGPRAARSLRGKGPLTLVFNVACADRSAALKAEHRIKQLSRADKEKFVAGQLERAELIG